jgi:biopolymer transport protein ExbD
MVFSTTGTSSGDGLSSEINVTPLIDVLLVMLIIFMVIVPVMPRGLNSVFPSAATAAEAEAADRPILIQVEQAEPGQMAVRYLVNGAAMERAEVAPRLQELLSRRSVRQVLLKGDGKLDFGVIAGVIDAGKAAGGGECGITDSRVCYSVEVDNPRITDVLSLALQCVMACFSAPRFVAI